MPEPAEPFAMPDLRPLSPAERKVAVANYHATLKPQADSGGLKLTGFRGMGASSSTNVKTAPQMTSRAAVTNAIIDVGGDHMSPLPAIVAAVRIAHAHENGIVLDESSVWDDLAAHPDALALALGEARETAPDHFVDVSKYDRMKSTTDKLFAKVRAIARSRDSKTQVARAQAEAMYRSPQAVRWAANQSPKK